MAGQRKQSPIVSMETRYGGKKTNGKPRKTGVNCVNADGEKFTLLNPSGKSAKYAAEIKRGVRYTNDGRVKRDDKGNALKFLANHYGIAMENTVAIGDNLNDRSMVVAAGTGVAVGNAVEGLKDAADFISLSNDEGAVAQVIKKFGYING